MKKRFARVRALRLSLKFIVSGFRLKGACGAGKDLMLFKGSSGNLGGLKGQRSPSPGQRPG